MRKYVLVPFDVFVQRRSPQCVVGRLGEDCGDEMNKRIESQARANQAVYIYVFNKACCKGGLEQYWSTNHNSKKRQLQEGNPTKYFIDIKIYGRKKTRTKRYSSNRIA